MDQTVPRCAAFTSGTEKPHAAEGRALVVAIVTFVDMVAEIVFGLVTGSMALLADGIHMGTHALALGVTVVAYALARKWRQNPGFAFGTGKVGVLGAYTNALLLGATALFMVVESVQRFLHPQSIEFDLALWVAGLGLVVNLVSALVLGGGHDHHHAHDHDQPHEHDSNLKAALAHVLADALTSVLAIAALFAARGTGWTWLDPLVGLVGAGLILSWAWGLLKDSGALLLDFGRWSHDEAAIVERLGSVGARVRDLHIWRYGEDQKSLLLTVGATEGASSPEEVRQRLGDLIDGFGHVNIEVNRG